MAEFEQLGVFCEWYACIRNLTGSDLICLSTPWVRSIVTVMYVNGIILPDARSGCGILNLLLLGSILSGNLQKITLNLNFTIHLYYVCIGLDSHLSLQYLPVIRIHMELLTLDQIRIQYRYRMLLPYKWNSSLSHPVWSGRYFLVINLSPLVSLECPLMQSARSSMSQ